MSSPVSFFLACLLVSGLAAAAQEQSTAGAPTSPDRTFAIVERSSVRAIQGSWQRSSPLLRYVHDHSGTYVVFAQGGELYRMDRPDQIAEVERLYAPMQELAVRQEAFAKAQKPLARNQQTLAAQQRDTISPMEKGRIGEAQGAIGQEQGDLGALQGDLGRQQGEVAKAAYRRMQTIFDRCLTDQSCSRIGASS